MNNEMAYLLGMVTGNGEIQRGVNETTVVIEIPHKKLETEFQKDVAIYVKASITDTPSTRTSFRNSTGICSKCKCFFAIF